MTFVSQVRPVIPVLILSIFILTINIDSLTTFPLTFAACMQIEILKSKIHRVKITEANLNYIGSITIDEDLMDAANLIENEKVQVLDLENGERLETYVIRGIRGSKMICMNGPAALKMGIGDTVIIISYCLMDFEAAKSYAPSIIFPKEDNSL
jgi:aspartate 1-decarboxylase